MKKVIIVPNPFLKDKEDIVKAVKENIASLESRVFDEALNDESSYERLEEAIKGSDFIITLGGDGSLLKVAETAATYGIPLLGINYGGVGHLTSLEKDELELLNDLSEEAYEIEERMMLDVEAESDRLYKKTALNDVMIVKKEINVPIKLKVNDTDIYYSDGIVIASPTGSSAYNYSAGGPLLRETGRQMVLTPICPVGRKSSYRIYDDDAVLNITSIRDTRDEALVSVDGFEPILINNKSRVRVKASKLVTRLVRI